MCGIAGIIYRDGGGEHQVGRDMTAMLQAMKHRGPDSTGYALYRPEAEGYVMHVKLAEDNGQQDFDLAERLGRQRADIESRMRASGATISSIDATTTEHAMTVSSASTATSSSLADYVEDVRGTEVLSLGRSLEIIKDLGDAETVAATTSSTASSARTRSVTRAWRPSPTSTSPTPTPTGPIRSPTWRWSTTAS